jgi:hypothetical protein
VLDQLTFETMESLVGTSFWAYPEQDHKVELRVVRVAEVMESQAAQLKRRAFSVFMLGPASYLIKQGTVLMTHDSFAEPLELFIVPVEQLPDGYLYEAVFT